MTRRIFISSVQKEFAKERKALGEYLRNDPLMRRFFDAFIFERDVPAADRRPDEVYLAEVASCDIYLTKYIERMGTGTRDMIRTCRASGLPDPEFALTDGFVVTLRRRGQTAGAQSSTQLPTQFADPVVRLLIQLGETEKSSGELREALELSHRPTFRENYLHPALEQELIEMTIPEKPTSSKQKYRLTAKGRKMLKSIQPESPDKP